MLHGAVLQQLDRMLPRCKSRVCVGQCEERLEELNGGRPVSPSRSGARFWLASSSPGYSMTPALQRGIRDDRAAGSASLVRVWGGESLLGHHEQLSVFASRDSLLVGRNFPVSEFREIRRVGPRERAGLENLAPPGS